MSSSRDKTLSTKLIPYEILDLIGMFSQNVISISLSILAVTKVRASGSQKNRTTLLHEQRSPEQ
jgi:hypothetical protein